MNGKNKRIKGVIKEDKRSVEREAIETTRKISEKKVNKGTRDGRRSGVEARSVSVSNRSARLTTPLCTVRCIHRITLQYAHSCSQAAGAQCSLLLLALH